MYTENSFLQHHLRCIYCYKDLQIFENVLRCSNCEAEYIINEGIPDFCVKENIFFPKNINLPQKYENYGKKNSRPESFQNIRRRMLTVEMIEGNFVLEIGAAEGWMSEFIIKKAKYVVCSDIAISYLKRARDKGIGAEFIRIDAHHLPFADETFDCVVLTEVLEHVYSPYRALEEVHRVLKPNGTMILSVPNNLSFSNILQHLINKKAPNKDAHLSFYDMFSIERLSGFVGFKINQTKSVFIYLPGFKPLFYFHKLQDILQVFFKNFGDKLILKAVKIDESLWDRL
jgi:ubiquinone/menaquinone biosynthesis C-methylase UbiE